jgi:hypothetical protein
MTARSRTDTLLATIRRVFSVRRRGADTGAATMLTVYIVLLLVWPSYITIDRLGSLGHPSLLWGLLLLFWWLMSRLQARVGDLVAVRQPMRYALGGLTVVALVSFAAAMLRGQPADQISPAITSIFRLASWAGVFLIAIDGIRTEADAGRLVRRLAVGGAMMAALGLAQFVSGQTLLDWMSSIPGLSIDAGEAITRGTFTRGAGTAIHPLEYGTVVVASLPLAMATAVRRGFRVRSPRTAGWWWIAVAVIVTASVVAVSRSAIIGLGVAALLSLPVIPAGIRWMVGAGGVALALVLTAAVPGLLGTTVALFAVVGSDASTQSRTGALDKLPEFVSSSPLIGQGFGTFLPRYYIFDDAWALMTVELGILGTLCIGTFVILAAVNAYQAGSISRSTDLTVMSRGVAGAAVTIVVLFFFFDGLSFPMSGGLLFLVAGLAGALRALAFDPSAERDPIDVVRALGREVVGEGAARYSDGTVLPHDRH